jgi:UDPglucose 6-dehydrogenase
MKYKIGIIGLGMVGDALRRYFEKKGNKPYIYDIKGEGSIEEVNKADFIYICVPTPYKDGCDATEVGKAISIIEGEKVVIIKSTILPGTTDKLQLQFPNHKILFNPEFLTESTADQDISYPDRQIIGYTHGSYTIAGDVMKQLPLAPYEAIVPAYVAEFTKYAANTWFAVKVAKNNELYDIFKGYGGNDEAFETMIDCVSADKRIGRSHLDIWHKGYRGYGGKCLPKDTKSFIDFAKSLGVKTPIMSASDKYNDKLCQKESSKRI